MTERRYDEDEVAEIFARATDERAGGGSPATGPHRGLTLRELESIAEEVGIAPERVAEAAHALDRRGQSGRPRTLLGAPRSVRHDVPLPRPPTDDEWQRLLADLRETFEATGVVRSEGALRSWSNGNLQAHVEPHGDGWRLRMQTLKGEAGTVAGMGTIFAVVGTLLTILALLDVPGRDLGVALAFMTVGFAQLGWLRASLPRWAEEREHQMQEIAERFTALLEP